MPIYEYQCKNCGMQKEFLRKVSDPPLTTCPECGKETLHKMVTAAGFQLKGTGWYATDFKGAPKTAPAKSDEASAKPADATAKADGDAKPEAKAETKTEAKSDSAAPTV
jgi:putative FmdB family regulatory protein